MCVCARVCGVVCVRIRILARIQSLRAPVMYTYKHTHIHMCRTVPLSRTLKKKKYAPTYAVDGLLRTLVVFSNERLC